LKANIPGPGSYNPSIDMKHKSMPNFSIGKEARENRAERPKDIPAPNKYFPNTSFIMKSSQQWG
jgi:hypothetical protein